MHADAKTAARTDGTEIVGLYDVLFRIEPSPLVERNRAVAVAMRDGPEAGLALIDAILGRGELVDDPFAHAARAEFCRWLGRRAEARTETPARPPDRQRDAGGEAQQRQDDQARTHRQISRSR